MRNFEKITKRSSRKDFAEFAQEGRKMNKVKRDRSHKRNWA
ncbi:hypothetical protein PFPBOIHM_00017 [Aeromonas phage avDM11-UST]|nr:hypothetical protein PFPBOIHM_00017 [Aeromonas phage avDM11-UST]